MSEMKDFHPRFMVFKQNLSDNECTALITLLKDAGFSAFVNDLYGQNPNWLQQMFSETPHRMYLLLDTLEEYTVTKDAPIPQPPHFAIYYSSQEQLSDHDWHLVSRYFLHLLYPLNPKPKISSRRAQTLLSKPDIQISTLPVQEEEPYDLPCSEYDYSFYLEASRDVGFAQIRKPYAEQPYTVVIRQFSKRGLEPLFTSLFIVSSWGVSPYDIAFLKNLWGFLKMPGDFDLDALMERDTKKCYPSEHGPGEQEPEVYRRTIEELIKQFQDKENGLF